MHDWIAGHAQRDGALGARALSARANETMLHRLLDKNSMCASLRACRTVIWSRAGPAAMTSRPARRAARRARKQFTLSPRLASQRGLPPRTNMKPRILRSAHLMPALETSPPSRQIRNYPLWNEPDPAAFLEARRRFEILVTNATAGAGASMMDALPCRP